MKRLLAFLTSAVLAAALFAGCAPTPTVEKDTRVDLSEVNWKITVEGASKGEYTMDEAKKHEFTKIYMTTYGSESDQGGKLKSSRIYEGVKLTDVLADLGVTEFTSITFVNTDETTVDYPYELATDGKCLLAWVENKKLSIQDSDSHVAAVGANAIPEQLAASVVTMKINK